MGLCNICGKPAAIFTCSFCGKLVCSNCFEKEHDICVKCHIDRI